MISPPIDQKLNSEIADNPLNNQPIICDDVLMEILSFLDDFKFVVMNYAFVSKQWFSAVSELSSLALTINNSTKLQGRFLTTISTLKVVKKNMEIQFDINILGKMEHLTNLNVSRNNIDTAGVKFISQLKHVKTLNIGYNRVDKKGLQFICEMKQLTNLNISGNDDSTLSLISQVSQLKQLTCLTIREGSIDEQGAKSLSKMDNLTHLHIYCNNVRSKGVTYFSGMKNLKFLNIGDNNLYGTYDKSEQQITELHNLTSLNISKNTNTSYFEHVCDMIQLTDLNIDKYNIDWGLCSISNLQQLTRLNTSNNLIGMTESKYIAQLKN